jgi:uncharacterized protein YqgC (DUF456 family)
MATVLFVVIWLGALVATFVPVVPATLIIWLAALLHAVLTEFQPLTSGFLIGLGVLAVAAMLVDNVAAAWGAKRFGGSSAAAWGALVGGLVGLLLGPLGFVVGPFLGAVASELLVSGKPVPEAIRSGIGTLLGMLGGIEAKLVIHLAMGVIVLVRVFTA